MKEGYGSAKKEIIRAKHDVIVNIEEQVTLHMIDMLKIGGKIVFFPIQ